MIFGGGGNDLVCAGWGDDKVQGGPHHDTVYGEPGNDKMRGGDGMTCSRATWTSTRASVMPGFDFCTASTEVPVSC